MKINNLSFPYPVLGIGDDIEPKPSILSADIKKEKKSYLFDVKLEMLNRDISSLIERGFATYTCEVESSGTLYRKCFFSMEPQFNLTIPRTAIAGRVNFQFFVTVVKPIKNYYNLQFHEDYYDYRFDLFPGDLLAFIGQFYYDADIKYDKLRSVGSFMQITEDKFESLPSYELGGPKINIKLPTPMYNQYKESILGNRQFSNIIHSSLVFNALVTALLFYEDNKDSLWARTLKYRIDNSPELESFINIFEENDPDEIIKLAQTLLMNPYKRLFDTLVENDIEDED